MSCVAVGEADPIPTGSVRTLAEHWNGTAWSVVATPNPTGTDNPDLVSVSCSSATDCLAVNEGQISEHWNGTSWTIVATADHSPLVDVWQDVVCTSSTSCVAAGYAYRPSNDPSLPSEPSAQSWNGSSWAVEAVRVPRPSDSTLLAAACSTSACFAVGQYVTADNKTRPLIERAMPGGWVPLPYPLRPGTEGLLSGVSCPTAAVCFAVGYTFDGKTLVERWNGKAWSIQRSPNNPNWTSSLTAVSCTSSTNCFAAGRYDGYLIGTLIEHWNGSTWSIVPSPSRKPTPQYQTPGYNQLLGISCATSSSCFAVGWDTGYNSTTGETLVLRWNGTKWAIVKSPNGAGAYNTLASVSCPAARRCYAVGNTHASGKAPASTLIETWNGNSWTRVATSDRAGAKRSFLLGVSCTSTTQCVAVGNDSDNTSGLYTSTVSKVLSGTNWSLVASADPSPGENATLNGVACPTAARCIGVGGYDLFPAHKTLVERFS